VLHLRHPGIGEVLEIGVHADEPFLVTEWLGSDDLASRLQFEGPRPERDAAELVEQLAQAVHYAHEAGCLHLDLTPPRILFAPDGQRKITDFLTTALAKRIRAADEEAVTAVAGPVFVHSYMAPEYLLHAPAVGPPADVYSLGMILYVCLTNRVPFQGSGPFELMAAILGISPPPPSSVRAGLAAELDRICLKCLEKDPARRYPTAQALAEALRRFLDGRPAEEPEVKEGGTEPEQAGGWFSRWFGGQSRLSLLAAWLGGTSWPANCMCFMIGLPTSLTAIIVGAIALKKETEPSLAVTGIVLGLSSMLIWAAVLVFLLFWH
jgi:serine/threonine protein kinase